MSDCISFFYPSFSSIHLSASLVVFFFIQPLPGHLSFCVLALWGISIPLHLFYPGFLIKTRKFQGIEVMEIRDDMRVGTMGMGGKAHFRGSLFMLTMVYFLQLLSSGEMNSWPFLTFSISSPLSHSVYCVLLQKPYHLTPLKFFGFHTFFPHKFTSFFSTCSSISLTTMVDNLTSLSSFPSTMFCSPLPDKSSYIHSLWTSYFVLMPSTITHMWMTPKSESPSLNSLWDSIPEFQTLQWLGGSEHRTSS